MLQTVELNNDSCIKIWESRVGESFYYCFRLFKRFKREVLDKHPIFGGMSPSQLIEYQEQLRGREAYVLKRLAQTWINGLPLRIGTKETYLSELSSFWLHNQVPWPKDSSFHFSSEVESVVGRLSFDNFRKILLNCDKMYRAVFLFMAHTFMGKKELVYSNVKHCDIILKALHDNVTISLWLPGRKRYRNKKPFYTVFNPRSDAGDALREYLNSLSEPPKECLFLNKEGRPLRENSVAAYFKQRAIEVGVIEEFTPNCSKCGGETVKFRNYKPGHGRIGYKCKSCHLNSWPSDFDSRFTGIRYGVTSHEIRDLMRTRWESSGANTNVAEFFMEHYDQVDPNDYLNWTKYQLQYPLREQMKALPWLNVLSCDPEKISKFEVDSKLEASEAKVDVLSKEVANQRRELADLRHDLEDSERERVASENRVMEWLEEIKKEAEKKSGGWRKQLE